MQNSIKVYLLMFMASFFWAGAFIAGKLGINDLSPALLTFLRMGIATLLIFPFLITKSKGTWRLKKTELKFIILTGLVGMIGYHMFFFTALKYTSASKASMINASNPLITAVLASIFVSEKLTPRKIFFIFMALFGVIFILVEGHLETLTQMALNKGDLIMLCGTVCWAVYSIIVRFGVKEMGALKLTAYTFLSSTLMMLPFAIYSFAHSNALHVGISPYIAVIYMAVFPTVVGYTIQQFAISQIGPTKTSLFINLVPILSTIMAVLFLGENVSIYHIIGAGLIIFAVISFSRQPQKQGKIIPSKH